MNSVVVQDLEESREPQLGLTLIAGSQGVKKKITHPQIQKMGLALTGFTRFVHPERLQVIGKTEITYFYTLKEEDQRRVVEQICSIDLACVVVTRDLEIPELLLEKAEQKGIPLFRTSLLSTDFIERVEKVLEGKLALTTSIHGVLMDVFGVGILILGKSGIGKSECALDLIGRGHRLVADDMVFLQKRSPAELIGSGFDVIRHHMEIRGLGIINIRSLFGVEAIREQKRVELVLELMEWGTYDNYDRLGLEEERYPILNTELPMLRIPVTPGRNLSTIIEVAARNHLLKMMGYHSALEFEKKLLSKIEAQEINRPDSKDEVE